MSLKYGIVFGGFIEFELVKSPSHVHLAEDCGFFEVMPNFLWCWDMVFGSLHSGIHRCVVYVHPYVTTFLSVITTFMTQSYDLRGSTSVMTPSDRRKANRSLTGF